MSDKDGGQAFPRSGFVTANNNAAYDTEDTPGMTLRQYIEIEAMKVLMAGLLNAPRRQVGVRHILDPSERRTIRNQAFVMADVMLEKEAT